MIVNIPFNFEVNYVANDTTKFSADKCLAAWDSVIRDAVRARLTACRTQLFDNRERVAEVSEWQIVYYTEKGSRKHYSFPAAKAMEEVLDSKDFTYLRHNPMQVLQVLKALYWVDKKISKINGYTFDNLYSVLLEFLVINK